MLMAEVGAPSGGLRALRNAPSGKAQQSRQEVATAITKGRGSLQREGSEGFCLEPQLGAVLARANRHSSGESHTWTQDPPILADVISKPSPTQTSLLCLNSNYCFPQN